MVLKDMDLMGGIEGHGPYGWYRNANPYGMYLVLPPTRITTAS